MKFKLLILIVFYIFSINQLFAQTLPHTFSANSAAKAEEVNENFQFLANQFKVNKKTIDCSTDNMTKAIEDGYNHLVLNGTCKGQLLITPVSGFLEKLYQNYGWVSNKPVYSLTLEGGSQGGVWDDTGIGAKTSLLVRGNLVLKNLTVKHQVSLQNNSLLIAEFFAAATDQLSFSVCLQEILELALDNNCSPVAEKVAEIKQHFASK